MLDSILLFIKKHTVITTITITVVALIAITTPIILDNYKLEKEVKDNMYMIVSSNYPIENENQIGENMQDSSNEDFNTDTPLTFKIVKTTTMDLGENMTTNMDSDGTEYKIVPSYDKEYSKWTKADKEAYAKAVEETEKMTEDDNKAVSSEGQEMQNTINEIENINSSYSKNYMFDISHSLANGEMELISEHWQYNSYTREYLGSIELYNSVIEENNRWNFSKSI